MTIDEFVAALREDFPLMRWRGWAPTMVVRSLRLKLYDRPDHCPITAVAEIRRNLPYRASQYQMAARAVGLSAADAQEVAHAADGLRGIRLRRRLIGAYREYCAALQHGA